MCVGLYFRIHDNGKKKKKNEGGGGGRNMNILGIHIRTFTDTVRDGEGGG